MHILYETGRKDDERRDVVPGMCDKGIGKQKAQTEVHEGERGVRKMRKKGQSDDGWENDVLGMRDKMRGNNQQTICGKKRGSTMHVVRQAGRKDDGREMVV